MFQVTQQDVPARLRLLRYGLVVVTITTFLVSFIAQFATLSVIPGGPGVGSMLGTALLFTVVVAVISAAIYFGYGMLLKNTVGKSAEGAEATA